MQSVIIFIADVVVHEVCVVIHEYRIKILLPGKSLQEQFLSGKIVLTMTFSKQIKS
ncbi:MAG: hypothetical protein O7D30_08880 [Rickettsia endosymbiont of Ixodes persulcatus]|nr:hypothetical protein [Rickettsia endosymbiont of Ixodes persulcatus]